MAQQSDVTILETKYRAKRAVKLDEDGRLRRVKKGELLDGSELIVSLVPDAFERVSANTNAERSGI
jgi:CO dehydrogenase/acetyl-CoA synthase beta subunit